MKLARGSYFDFVTLVMSRKSRFETRVSFWLFLKTVLNGIGNLHQIKLEVYLK